MNQFNLQMFVLLSFFSLTTICHAQENQITPPVSSIASPSVNIKNLYPIFRISDVIKKNIETKIFKIIWVGRIKEGQGQAPFFESTDIVYYRDQHTLKYHYRENNIGIRRSYLYTKVTDEALYKLIREAEETQRAKKVAAIPVSFFDNLTNFGCQKEKL